MINESNFLDLHDIFINELVGDVVLAIIISLVLVWFLSIKVKMPFELSILFGLLLLSIFFAQYTSLITIWVFVVLIIGLMFYYAINKIMR